MLNNVIITSIQEDKVAIILSLIVKAIHQSVRYDNTPNTFYAPVSSEILQDHVQDYFEYLGFPHFKRYNRNR
ncbi:MAG: hypothetical protein IPO92_18950 [Saprospiraceae bacterium]|nr:hypothetical protein [Saprospiraceae bacterium]